VVGDLFQLEPRLLDLKNEVDGVRDDGSATFFCSNYVWLPVNTRLRLLLGVARVPQADDDEHPELYDSRSYELVFVYLSQRLPPCRDCGCRIFKRLREELSIGV
jgi:hypothetical protein